MTEMWMNEYGEWEVPVETTITRYPWDRPVEPVVEVREVKPVINVPVNGVSKSEVMKLAHMIRKDCENAHWGLCLKEAWRLTKVRMLEREQFIINMADMPDRRERARRDEISQPLLALHAA